MNVNLIYESLILAVKKICGLITRRVCLLHQRKTQPFLTTSNWVITMSPQERKKRNQRLYQKDVEAIRNGRKKGTVMVSAPRGMKQCQNPVVASFFN
jgi:hypothetical protein